MKIYISQGHEKGIGLEVFIKTCLMLSKKDLGYIELIAYKSSVKKTLLSLGLPFEFKNNSIIIAGINIATTWLTLAEYSQSFSALNEAMKLSKNNGVLFTLPTSKDQFPGFSGHTEYFRSYFNAPELGMHFSSSELQVLLLSDHIPLKEVPQTMTEDLIYKRIHNALISLKKLGRPVARVLISGINPHAGEGGLIGNEDARITSAIRSLSSKFKFEILGPFPADTMLMEQKSTSDILVYIYHDQGLGVFKSLQGYIGSNITLGLPFPRFSPDHGTSFGLYGKNQSDYRGCAYSLKEAINVLKRNLSEKNTSHKSKST